MAPGQTCDRVEPPKATQGKTVKHFTLEQTEAFLSTLNNGVTIQKKAHDRIDDTGKEYHVDAYSEHKYIQTQFKVFFNLALFCGLRRGDLIALEWSDFDFDQNTVSISKSTSIIDGKLFAKPPKTESSNRLISVPASIMAQVKLYRKEQLEYRMNIGSAWEDGNHLFTQWNGRQMYPSTLLPTYTATSYKRQMKQHLIPWKISSIPKQYKNVSQMLVKYEKGTLYRMP